LAEKAPACHDQTNGTHNPYTKGGKKTLERTPAVKGNYRAGGEATNTAKRRNSEEKGGTGALTTKSRKGTSKNPKHSRVSPNHTLQTITKPDTHSVHKGSGGGAFTAPWYVWAELFMK